MRPLNWIEKVEYWYVQELIPDLKYVHLVPLVRMDDVVDNSVRDAAGNIVKYRLPTRAGGINATSAVAGRILAKTQ